MHSKICALDPILRVVLEGVYDQNCILYSIKGTPHIIQCIWEDVKVYNSGYWKSLIKVGSEPPCPSTMTESGYEQAMNPIFIGVPQDKYFLEITDVVFPEPKALNIFMMPFIISKCFELTKLPKYLYSYWQSIIFPLLRSYQSGLIEEESKICYLTIHEMDSKAINKYSPLSILDDKCRFKYINKSVYKGKGSSYARYYKIASDHEEYMKIDRIRGGIYIAFNYANAASIWNAKIKCDKSKGYKEIVDNSGEMEHIKPYLGEPTTLRGNAVYWITDRTPLKMFPPNCNESYFQYFQIVTSQVSYWFEEFSTSNPFDVFPDKEMTEYISSRPNDF